MCNSAQNLLALNRRCLPREPYSWLNRRHGMTRYDTFTTFSLSVRLRLLLLNNSGIAWLPNPLRVNPTLSDLQFYIFFLRSLRPPTMPPTKDRTARKCAPERKWRFQLQSPE